MEASRYVKNLLVGALLGFFLGFLLLHPFAMLFQEMIHPTFHLDLSEFKNAFNPHHLPMAFFFGVLSMIITLVVLLLLAALSKEKQRVQILEGLLPICSYCKKIREDAGKSNGKDNWVQIEKYVSQRSDADFSHGICPSCYEKHIRVQLDDLKAQSGGGKK